MSYITHLILHVSSFYLEERMDEVNTFFEPFCPQQVDDYGQVHGKPWTRSIFIGAYNFFPMVAFLEHLEKVEWEYPDYVQVLAATEEGHGFRTIIEITPDRPDLPEEEILARLLEAGWLRAQRRMQESQERMAAMHPPADDNEDDDRLTTLVNDIESGRITLE
jgi:hypothetical protein